MNKGFSLVELLAAIVILALLVVISVPAYTKVFSDVKNKNYTSKIVEVEAAAMKYSSTIKDDIKNNTSCIKITVADLIKKGYLTSERDSEDVILNPMDNKPLNGFIKMCYCSSRFDVQAKYATTFDVNKVYYKGEVVEYNGKLYECTHTYKDKSGINGTYEAGPINKKEQRKYFNPVAC